MLTLAWRGVRHNTGRYIATLVAIITGVGFLAAAGFLSDRVIDALEGDVNRQYGAVDAAVVADRDGDFADTVRITGEEASAIAGLDGVEGVAGEVTGPVAFQLADGTVTATNATGRLWVEDEVLNPIDLIDGAAPAAADEIALDRDLADREDLALGDEVTLLTANGPAPVRVVGITEFGNAGAIDSGGTVSLPAASAFTFLTGGAEQYQELLLRGGGSQAELVDAITPLVPEGFVAQTGDEFLDDKRSEASAFGRVLKQALTAFSALALVVGGFVIFNTFNVIVTQRLRELAVLSAIGATPKQLRRSLRLEALVIGVIGSALGVLTGFLLALLLLAVINALGVDLPGSGLKASTTVIVRGMLAGTIITYLSVRGPARKAARIEPIEALRQSAVETTSVSRRRIITIAVLGVLGLGGLFSGEWLGLALGTLALFFATIAAGPVLAMLAAKVLRPLARLFGLEGRLAVDNTARNPQRTATTANALLIGVFLVTLVTVSGTSIRDYAVGEVNKLSGADFILSSDGGSIDDALVADLKALDHVRGVAVFRSQTALVGGEASAISAGNVDDLVNVATLKLSEGSFADLDDDSIVVAGGVTIGAGPTAELPTVGDTVTVAGATGQTGDLRVVGVLESSLDVAATGNFVTEATFTRLVGDQPASNAFMKVEPGRQSDVEDLLADALSTRPDIVVLQGSQFAEAIGSVFDFIINAVNGLLLLSVLVALIGIVNTMSLSIIERRRELGLLRVVGMIDRRVRRMVRLESVVIAGLGTASGLALGIVIGWAIVRAMSEAAGGVEFSAPWTVLATILVLGVVLGFLAALIPARRSTRLDVLEALQAT